MRIGEHLDFNTQKFIGQRAIFQGASGSGKSNGARMLLEATFKEFQHLVLDVEDEFHTLRTDERQYAILGGDHGDVPLTPDMDAGALALTLLDLGISTVLQIGDWTLDHKRLFIGSFIAGMMRAKPAQWHKTIVMLDEAHNWCPQQGVVESSQAVTHLATAGRKRSFSMILATQRLSLINKDVLGQCENKFLGRVEQSADRRSVADLLGFGPNSNEAIDMQRFAPGEFYAVGPALAHVPTRVQLDKASTRAPEPGTNPAPAPSSAKIRKAFAAIAQQQVTAAAETPPAAAAGAAPVVSGVPEAEVARLVAEAEARGRVIGYKAGRSDAGRLIMSHVTQFVLENDKAVYEGAKPVEPDVRAAGFEIVDAVNVVATARVPVLELKASGTPPGVDPNARIVPVMSSAVKRLIGVIESVFPTGIKMQLAAKRAKIGMKSSNWPRYMAELKNSDQVRLRDDGRWVATKVMPPDDMMAPPDRFRDVLTPTMNNLLSALWHDSGNTISLDTLAERAGISRTSSGLTAGLKELRELGLAEKVDGGWRFDQQSF